MNSKRIVAAVDGSEHSDMVVEKAIEYAKLLEAQVVLIYCHRRFPVMMGQIVNDKQIPAIISEAEKLAHPYLQQLLDAEVTAELRLMEEPAGHAITEVARIEKCDLIVMGCRGLTDLAGLIIGSVTHRVLQLATCPVLVVR